MATSSHISPVSARTVSIVLPEYYTLLLVDGDTQGVPAADVQVVTELLATYGTAIRKCYAISPVATVVAEGDATLPVRTFFFAA